MTQLNAGESALFLMQLAMNELSGQDLHTKLARLRLEKAVEAVRGNVDMQEYEKKILGKTT